MGESILKKEEISVIKNEMAEIFSTDGKTALNEIVNGKLFRNKLKSLATETILTPSWAASAYEFIFGFRKALTKETITYRYYYQDEEGKHKVKMLPSTKILEYMTFTDSQISVLEKKAKSAQNINKYQKILEDHFDKVKNSIFKTDGYGENGFKDRTVSGAGSSYFIIKSTTLLNNVSKQRFHYFTYAPQGSERNEIMAERKWFNRGNIYEAFDEAATTLLKNGKNIEGPNATIAIRGEMLKKTLQHDNIKGTRTGDVGLTQIKSNSARFFEYSTLKNILGDMNSIFNLTTKKDEENMEKNIKEMINKHFAYSSDKNELEDIVDKYTKKILKVFPGTNGI